MRSLFLLIFTAGWFQSSAATGEFISEASEAFGESGKRAAQFLVEYMSEADRETLSVDFLMENLKLSFQAREQFVWARKVPEDIFLNHVLPYAVFDEPRDRWRASFCALAGPMVKDAKSAKEAAQILNRDFFKTINTHYSPRRKRANQSPRESIEQGKASCTGLTIILVNACRAVGIPARAVGIPMWTDRSGNHTWVEIWDGQWHFTGADEYEPKGLNHAWFSSKASAAKADVPQHAIYATTWEKSGLYFPMPWSPQVKSVGAINVTDQYIDSLKEESMLGIRLWDEHRTRIAAQGVLVTKEGQPLKTFKTKAGRNDLNDMVLIQADQGQSYRLRFLVKGKWMQTDALSIENLPAVVDVNVCDLNAEGGRK